MNDDLISRQAAIDAYLETISALGADKGDGVFAAWARDRDILKMLNNLPSAQSETAYWIYTTVDDIPVQKCSHCRSYVRTLIAGWPHYCPHCGAKMVEVEDK